MRKGGLEPPCLSAPPPQDGVSANFTTSAHTSGCRRIPGSSRTQRQSKYSKGVLRRETCVRVFDNQRLLGMLTDKTKTRINQYRGMALGLFQSVGFPPGCNEYVVRNGLSRLYYAVFHASLAFLLSRGESIEETRKNHGVVHTEIEKYVGKYVGRRFREVYAARLQSDYEPDMIVVRYQGQLDRARVDAENLRKRISRDFYWLQQESREALAGRGSDD